MSVWLMVANEAQKKADAEKCPDHDVQKVVGYSNLGVPMAVCPVCSPSIADNAHKPVGDVRL